MSAFTYASPSELQQALHTTGYVAAEALATVVFLAAKLEKPLLVEGPAGVGKTELAKSLARALERPLIRLQCYEGLDESKALYEWEYAKQMLYIQILKEKIGESLSAAATLQEAMRQLLAQEDAFFAEPFLLPRPLLKALRSPIPCVLLIDEVDKSDPEFEAFLLEFLSEFAVTIPELGTFRAVHPPLVLLTSNDQRDLSDALKRRCLHLFIDYPPLEIEKQIVALKVPQASAELLEKALNFVHRLRQMDLKKAPSIAESVEWLKGLLTLQLQEWNAEAARATLSILLKYQSDLLQAQKLLERSFV